jgi:hypothetical protein
MGFEDGKGEKGRRGQKQKREMWGKMKMNGSS